MAAHPEAGSAWGYFPVKRVFPHHSYHVLADGMSLMGLCKVLWSNFWHIQIKSNSFSVEFKFGKFQTICKIVWRPSFWQLNRQYYSCVSSLDMLELTNRVTDFPPPGFYRPSHHMFLVMCASSLCLAPSQTPFIKQPPAVLHHKPHPSLTSPLLSPSLLLAWW